MADSSDGGAGWWGAWGAGAWEVLVFFLFVVASTCAPLWHRGGGGGGGGGGGDKPALGGKLAFIFAGGNVSTAAVVLSIARGTLGVRSFLGFPSELVYRGAGMWETLWGMCLALPLVGWLLVPLYVARGDASVYSYLQARFRSRAVRRAAAATFLLRQLLNLAVTAYTPVVALAAAGAPPAAAAAALAAAAAAATLAGGLTQAIRADVLQTVSMLLISGVFLAQAWWASGGPAVGWAAARAGGRLQFLTWSGDARTRVDTLSAVVGQLFMSLSVYGCQQTFVQRYVSLGGRGAARRALWAAVPAVAALFSLSWVVGVALYGLYAACDPLAAHRTAAPDQLLPYYVQDQLAAAPGLMGLFLGCLFNGALSFMVSNVNSLATVTWEDFVSQAPAFRGLDDARQLTVIKIIAILYACVVSALSLCVGRVGGVVEGSQLVTAATGGALLGVFALAAACPLASARAALAGVLAAHGLTAALVVGRLLLPPAAPPLLPLRTDGCDNATLAALAAARVGEAGAGGVGGAALEQALLQLAPLLPPPPALPTGGSGLWHALVCVCQVSYMWYAVLGSLVCVLVGNAVGALSAPPRAPFDDALLHPLAARLVRRLPALGGVPRTYHAGKPPAPPPAPAPPTPSVSRALAAPLKAAAAAAVPPPPAPAPAPPLSSCRLFDAYSPPRPAPDRRQ